MKGAAPISGAEEQAAQFSTLRLSAVRLLTSLSKIDKVKHIMKMEQLNTKVGLVFYTTFFLYASTLMIAYSMSWPRPVKESNAKVKERRPIQPIKRTATTVKS
jgi:hypothetical protein